MYGLFYLSWLLTRTRTRTGICLVWLTVAGVSTALHGRISAVGLTVIQKMSELLGDVGVLRDSRDVAETLLADVMGCAVMSDCV